MSTTVKPGSTEPTQPANNGTSVPPLNTILSKPIPGEGAMAAFNQVMNQIGKFVGHPLFLGAGLITWLVLIFKSKKENKEIKKKNKALKEENRELKHRIKELETELRKVKHRVIQPVEDESDNDDEFRAVEYKEPKLLLPANEGKIRKIMLG